MLRRILTLSFNLLLAIIIVPLGWISYVEIGKIIGKKPIPVEVAGTGSMYPSLYWDVSQGGPEQSDVKGIEEYRSSPRMYRYYRGLNIGKFSYFRSQLDYGDMVAFSSPKTREILIQENKNPNLGFIKRLIAMPGDTIELRDGFVIINDQIIKEPYIRSPRSTFGGSSLGDCQKITIPPHSYFVLGDNRKVSSDSRFDLGLVQDEEIQFYLPLSKQAIYQSLWRDPASDAELSNTPTLDPSDLYHKISRLKRNPTLEKSAKYRAQALLNNPNTKIDLSSSLAKAGYHNKVIGEFVTYGYFTADELWENLQHNSNIKAQLNSSDYQEIGITAVLSNVNGCPTQVIVGHYGGYVPASYPAEMKENWQAAKTNIDEVIASWEQAKGQSGIDQDILATLLSLLSNRRALIAEVLQVITNREWISDELERKINDDAQTAAQIENLANQLNRER